MLDSGIYVLCCFISPYRQERENLKSKFSSKDFVEIYVKTTIEEAKKRDPKGLYAKAQEDMQILGINSPYEGLMTLILFSILTILLLKN